MAIIGAHMLLYTSDEAAVRKILADAFGFGSIDAGGGWPIFALPPAELGVHPAEGEPGKSGGHHQISFMCDDLKATMKALAAKGIKFSGEPSAQTWGTVVTMNLPGGLDVMLYEPKHRMAIKPARHHAAPTKRTKKKAPSTRRRAHR